MRFSNLIYFRLVACALVALAAAFNLIDGPGYLGALGLVGAISFTNIPAVLRVPLFYAEMDASQAGYFSQPKRALLIGQKLSTGSQAVNTAVIVSSSDQAIALFGRGSMLARMVNFYRQQDPFGELWCIALADNGAGVAATGTCTVTGPATAAGTINLYIAGQLVQVAVGSTDTANTVAASINTAINAATDLPVTSTVSTNVVTMTCRWKGLSGNDITILDSFRGQSAGESLPTGIALAYSGSNLLTGGTTAPTISNAITAMGDDEYDYVIHPYNDSSSMTAFTTEYNDSAGRWSYARQVYGHTYTALRGTLGSLQSGGGALNDQHATMAAIDVDCPNPVWEYAAAYGGRNAVFLNVDPARPTQTGVLTGVIAPRAGKKFLASDRQSLLTYGVATSYVSVGTVRIERAITTYQKNAFGQADPSYLDSETLHTSAYVIRNLRSVITTKYPRHKLANDGTRFGAGQAIVTPKVIRGELASLYAQMEEAGIVENAALFAKYLIVERNATDPNRLDVLFPPDYVNQLRVFAVLNQFRLQYSANA